MEERFDLWAVIVIASISLLFGFIIGFLGIGIEIQNVKPVDDGYYITINDEIYFKEVID